MKIKLLVSLITLTAGAHIFGGYSTFTRQQRAGFGGRGAHQRRELATQRTGVSSRRERSQPGRPGARGRSGTLFADRDFNPHLDR